MGCRHTVNRNYLPPPKVVQYWKLCPYSLHSFRMSSWRDTRGSQEGFWLNEYFNPSSLLLNKLRDPSSVHSTQCDTNCLKVPGLEDWWKSDRNPKTLSFIENKTKTLDRESLLTASCSPVLSHSRWLDNGLCGRCVTPSINPHRIALELGRRTTPRSRWPSCTASCQSAPEITRNHLMVPWWIRRAQCATYLLVKSLLVIATIRAQTHTLWERADICEGETKGKGSKVQIKALSF